MRLRLPEVTLCCVDTSERFDWAVHAVARCVQAIEFGDAFVASDARRLASVALPPGVRGVAIEPLPSIAAYSRFMLERVAPLLRTPQVLVVQWDGFVIHPEHWDPAFLQYDYIGAPWRHLRGPYRVGNGGFSLRSLRLLQALPPLPAGFDEPEDAFIARRLRPQLEARGLRFAPVEVAERFSVENGSLSRGPFGFHGPQHFPVVLGAERTLAYLRTLSPATLFDSRPARDAVLGLAAAIEQARHQRLGFGPAQAAMAGLLEAAAQALDLAACAPAELDGLCRALIRTGHLSAAQLLIARAVPVWGAARMAPLQTRLAARRLQRRWSGR